MPRDRGLTVSLGFSQSGVLRSRSVMLPELTDLMAIAPVDADTATLQRLVVDEDALHKPSAANRTKTFSFLRNLYGLNPGLPIYREFTRLCHLSPADTTVLAGSLAFAREPVLKACADKAPLAQALLPMVTVAKATLQPAVGGSVAHQASTWANDGWTVDAAVLAALAIAQAADCVGDVEPALAAVYRPWLQRSAESFQQRVAAEG